MPWHKDIRVPMRDGRGVAADLFVPEGRGPWPAILIQTPYGKEKLGAALPHGAARSWLEFWDRAAYALLIADWRGYHGSREPGDGVPPAHRGEDGVDLVRWIAAQAWSDERVAAWGPSALGRAVLRTAELEPLPLVCGIPLVCHMGHFYEDLYEGGVLQEAHLDAIRGLGFPGADEIRGAPLPSGEFWRRGAEEYRPESLNIPLLLVTGWFDLVTAQTLRFFSDLQTRAGPRARAYSRLLVGPWHHTAIDHRRQGQIAFPGAAGAAADAMSLFTDHWTRRRQDRGWSELTGVRYWQMGEDRWIDAPTWPPPGLREAILHPTADGRLASTRPAGTGERSFTSDPEDPVPTVGGANLPIGMKAGPYDQTGIEARDDVLSFTGEAFDALVPLTGSAALTLTAVTDAVDFDFAVRLTDVGPDGRSMLLGDSIRRAKLRGDPGRPMPLTPGVPYEVTVTLPPLAHTFLPGHRIRVSVAGSNWPRYERNPHTGADHFDPSEAYPATTTLLFGPDTPCHLTLPVRA